MTTFESIVENKNKDREFSAQIAGAKIKSSGPSSSSSSPRQQKSGLADRLRSKMQKNKEKDARSGKSTNFSDGVGYQVIG